MHNVYKVVSPLETQRIFDYCRVHNVKNGGLFELYPDPEVGFSMIIVNSSSESAPKGNMRPLGAFYLNYSGPGVISIEEEDPHFDGSESRKRHVAAIKQVIDILLKDGYPGNKIAFEDFPCLQ